MREAGWLLCGSVQAFRVTDTPASPFCHRKKGDFDILGKKTEKKTTSAPPLWASVIAEDLPIWLFAQAEAPQASTAAQAEPQFLQVLESAK